ALLARRQFGRRSPVSRLAVAWFGTILAQIFLGAATIWSGKSAGIATAHVAVGALSLVTGALTTIIAMRGPVRSGAVSFAPRESEPSSFSPPPATIVHQYFSQGPAVTPES